ncbi:uncharacterized protein FZC25_8795g2065 [Saccharomyces cerevisiae]|nr:uncharacterized protein FZC25_8795g2065 [Saccharomyces cerevisiae]
MTKSKSLHPFLRPGMGSHIGRQKFNVSAVALMAIDSLISPSLFSMLLTDFSNGANLRTSSSNANCQSILCVASNPTSSAFSKSSTMSNCFSHVIPSSSNLLLLGSGAM